MPATKKSPRTVVLDPAVLEDANALNEAGYSCDEAVSTFSDEVAAPMCLTCGELLAWHEEPCSAATMPLPTPSVLAVEEITAPFPGSVISGFTYAIGQPVHPAPDTLVGKVIWRGQVKERHPRTGLLHRVNVYRLDNGYWDCYYEAELQAA